MVLKPRDIVDAIKINVEIAKIDGKPIYAEVSMSEKSKDYIESLIVDYAKSEYERGLKSKKVC